MAGIFDTGIFDSGIFDTPATGITGTFAATEAEDTAALTGFIAHTGTLAATEGQDVAAFAGFLAHVGALAATEAEDSFAAAGALAGVISGFLSATEAQDAAAAEGTVLAGGEVIGKGFEMGGKAVRQTKTVREVKFKPLLERILEARAERIKPVKKAARAKAREIEGIAAELAMNDGGEKQFRALMDQWLAQGPQLPEVADLDVEQLFMAQVAMRVQRIQEARRLFEQDEEDALMVLLA